MIPRGFAGADEASLASAYKRKCVASFGLGALVTSSPPAVGLIRRTHLPVNQVRLLGPPTVVGREDGRPHHPLRRVLEAVLPDLGDAQSNARVPEPKRGACGRRLWG